MTFVEIGDAGNDAFDGVGSQYPFPAGAVSYEYDMGKHEISRGMISAYNSLHGTANSRQITMADMTGGGGNGVDKPATGVSWNEAARFVNWLNISQGFQAAYNFSTSGVNDNIALWDSGDAWQDGGENLFRHKNAMYWLPSVDEWYKAAYYNSSGSTWQDYATLNGNVPTAVASGTADNTAVYDQDLSSGPAEIIEAGGLNQFGIMGITGNVLEWTEGGRPRSDNTPGASRTNIGGNWTSGSFLLSTSNSGFGGTPDWESPVVGFRVASLSSSAAAVPEPSSAIAMSLLFGLGVAGRRLRRRNAAAATH